MKESPILFAYFSRTINHPALIVRQMQPCAYQANSINDGRFERGRPPLFGRLLGRRSYFGSNSDLKELTMAPPIRAGPSFGTIRDALICTLLQCVSFSLGYLD